MKRNANYTDEPMGQLEVVEDFLPPPDRIVLKEDGVKVTISLSKHSVEFFKAHAQDRRCRIKKWSADCWIPMRFTMQPWALGCSGTNRANAQAPVPLRSAPIAVKADCNARTAEGA